MAVASSQLQLALLLHAEGALDEAAGLLERTLAAQQDNRHLAGAPARNEYAGSASGGAGAGDHTCHPLVAALHHHLGAVALQRADYAAGACVRVRPASCHAQATGLLPPTSTHLPRPPTISSSPAVATPSRTHWCRAAMRGYLSAMKIRLALYAPSQEAEADGPGAWAGYDRRGSAEDGAGGRFHPEVTPPPLVILRLPIPPGGRAR